MIYKEMEYGRESKTGLLATDTYLGIPYFIMNLGYYPTAYVVIPETNPLHKIEDYGDMPIHCHGGLSFGGNELYVGNHTIISGKIIGWDYAHYGDYTSLAHIGNSKLGMEDGKKWAVKEIINDVKDVIRQIVALGTEQKKGVQKMNKKETIIEILKKLTEIKFDILEEEELMLDDDSVHTFLNLLPEDLIDSIKEELENMY